MWKKIGLLLLVLLLLLSGSLAVLAGYLDWSEPSDLSKTQMADLPYLAALPAPTQGKILAIVTSTAQMEVPTDDGVKLKKAGFELTELSRAYAVFSANGFAVDVASPQGGAAPYVRDEDDMGPYDHAFLNDPIAMAKISNTLKLSAVKASDYKALYLVGGKGTMFDFRGNRLLQQLVADSWQQGAVVSAVCHGPAGLLGVKLSDGSELLRGRKVTAFTNAEELFLIPKATQVFGTLLQDDLQKAGAEFVEGPLYLNQLAQDGRLITGQNPWSVWALADAVVRELGITPKARDISNAELAVELLDLYHHQGLAAAEAALEKMPDAVQAKVDRNLIAMHLLVALMQYNWQQGVDLMSLLRLTAKAAKEGA
jgi:putative intracellular protease/amidase